MPKHGLQMKKKKKKKSLPEKTCYNKIHLLFYPSKIYLGTSTLHVFIHVTGIFWMLTNIRHLVPDDTQVNKSNKIVLEGTQGMNTQMLHIKTQICTTER